MCRRGRGGREGEALARYCDAAEAGGAAAELPLFWLRVALAEGRERPGAVAPELLSRCAGFVGRLEGVCGARAGRPGGPSGVAAPPPPLHRRQRVNA